MRVGSAWGAASSRADRIWTGRAAGLAGEADLPGASLDAEVAYGLDALRGLLTSYTGVALSENGEDVARRRALDSWPGSHVQPRGDPHRTGKRVMTKSRSYRADQGAG